MENFTKMIYSSQP